MRNSIPYFDAHCDTLSRAANLRENAGHLDLARLSAFRKAAQIFAIFRSTSIRDGLTEECQRQQMLFAQEMSRNRDLAVPCCNAAEIRQANREGKVAALLSCEGAELMDCDPEQLDWARDAGVVSINLTWNFANELAGSNAEEPERGLSDLGRAFVRRAWELGILIDVSHCSDAAFWDLIEMADHPVIASHSNARMLCPHRRNLTDEMFLAIARTGGVVGLNYYHAFVEPDSLVRHVEHWMELGGERHICLGGDLDGCDSLADGMKGVQDVPLLWEALSRRGCPEALLVDIFYNNLLRVLETP